MINDTFWVVWRNARKFRGESAPSTWILGIAYRKARSAFRASARLAAKNLAIASEPLTAETPTGTEELRDWLGQALAQIPPSSASPSSCVTSWGIPVKRLPRS